MNVYTLNLLVYDIFKLKNVSALEEMAKTIVKTINNTHILKSTFVIIQKSKKKVFTTLKMPVKTRWGSIVHCLKSLIQNKGILLTIIFKFISNLFVKHNYSHRLNHFQLFLPQSH